MTRSSSRRVTPTGSSATSALQAIGCQRPESVSHSRGENVHGSGIFAEWWWCSMFESMVAVGAPGWFIVPPSVRSAPHVRLPVGARSFPMPLHSLLNRGEGTALRKGPPRGNAPRSEATEGRSRVRLDGCGSVGKPCPASEQLLRGSLGSPPYLVGVDGDDATSLDDPATIDP